MVVYLCSTLFACGTVRSIAHGHCRAVMTEHSPSPSLGTVYFYEATL